MKHLLTLKHKGSSGNPTFLSIYMDQTNQYHIVAKSSWNKNTIRPLYHPAGIHKYVKKLKAEGYVETTECYLDPAGNLQQTRNETNHNTTI